MKLALNRFFLSCVLLIGTVSGLSQRPTTSGGQSQKPASVVSDTLNLKQDRDRFFNAIAKEDTLDAFYYNLLLPSIIKPVSDTALHEYSHHYDWSRLGNNDFAHLGNVGSAALPIVYEQTIKEGFDIGLHQFDLWKFQDKDRKFYDLSKSFTHFDYSQGSQQNQVFKATLARAFEDNFRIAVDYRRINQLGIYQRQNVDHSNLHLGLGYHHPNQRYKIYFSLISNGLEFQENGGITTDTLFGMTDFTTAATIPVALDITSGADQDGAEGRHQERRYQIYQSYRLLKDSSDLSKPQITLSNAITFSSNFYKYGDASNGIDETFYGENLFVNPQGLRMYLTEKVYANHFKIFLARETYGDSEVVRKTHLEAGLKLSNHRLDNEISDSTIFNVMLTGGGQIDLGKNIALKTDNYFTVAGDNIGSYKIQGDFLFSLNKIGSLKANIINQNYQPSIIQNLAPVSNQYLWQNDFSNINEFTIGANYEISSLNVEVGLGYHLINNYIFFDDTFQPVQKSAEISVLQLTLEKDFRVGKFHLDNYLAYQTSSGDELPVPELFTKHSLYFEGLVFKKKMLLRTGLDVRTISGYSGYSYMPLLGQFYPNTSLSLEGLNQIDFFTSFKVGNMRLFLKMEHLEDFGKTKKDYFISNYPNYDSAFRFGLSWYLIN